MAKLTKLSSIDYGESFLYNNNTYYRGTYNRKKRMYLCFKYNHVLGSVNVTSIYLPGTFIVYKI